MIATPTREAWVKHRAATEALQAVLEAFEREGIAALPVKGIILAHSLYADVAERPISDIDLRVVSADLGRVERLARREGWGTYRNSRQLGSRAMDVRNTLVEIETTIGPPGLCAVGVEDLLHRSTEAVGGLGFRHREPEIHDHALVLCVNAFKDKLVGGAPWTRGDLVRLARQPTFDAKRMVRLAEEAGLVTALWVVAGWVAAAEPVSPWGAVHEALGRLLSRPRYARLFQSMVERRPHSRYALPVLARMGSDRPWMRAKALVLGAYGTLAFSLAHLREGGGRSS